MTARAAAAEVVNGSGELDTALATAAQHDNGCQDDREETSIHHPRIKQQQLYQPR